MDGFLLGVHAIYMQPKASDTLSRKKSLTPAYTLGFPGSFSGFELQ